MQPSVPNKMSSSGPYSSTPVTSPHLAPTTQPVLSHTTHTSAAAYPSYPVHGNPSNTGPTPTYQPVHSASSDVHKPQGVPTTTFHPSQATPGPSAAYQPVSATPGPTMAFQPASLGASTTAPSTAFQPPPSPSAMAYPNPGPTSAYYPPPPPK